MNIELPAICDNCGAVFPSGFAFAGSGSVTMIGNKSGPCPRCGGWGSVPDGIYEFASEAEKIFADLPTERRESLAANIDAARKGPKPRKEVTEALANVPGLAEAVKHLLVPLDAGQFWAFIAAIIAIIALLGGGGEDKITIQKVINEHAVGAEDPWTLTPVAKRPPPPPRKQAKAKKKRGSRRR